MTEAGKAVHRSRSAKGGRPVAGHAGGYGGGPGTKSTLTDLASRYVNDDLIEVSVFRNPVLLSCAGPEVRRRRGIAGYQRAGCGEFRGPGQAAPRRIERRGQVAAALSVLHRGAV